MTIQAGYLQTAAILSQAAYGTFQGNTGLSAPTVALANGFTALSYTQLWPYSSQLAPTDFMDGYFDFDAQQALIVEGLISGQKVVAIAFRGTSDFTDFLNDVFILENDAYTLFSNAFIRSGLIEAVKGYAAAMGAKILVTGHSLGGAFAEIYMANNYDATTVGVTFGSPSGQLGVGTLPRQGELLNIGHGVDPVFNVANAGANGVDVSVGRFDVPDFSWTGKLGVVQLGTLWGLTGELWEHDIQRYVESAAALAGSRFYTVFGSALQTYDIEIVTLLGGNYGLTAGNNKAIFIGSQDSNSLYGGPSSDVLEGRGGADVIVGFDGSDRIDGGSGDDLITGGAGNDEIYGGTGYDVAKYSLNRTQYQFTYANSGGVEYITIAPANGAQSTDGADTVYSDVDAFQFLDTYLTWQQLVSLATGGSSSGTGGQTYNPGGAAVGDLPDNTTTPSSAIVTPGTNSLAGVVYKGVIESSNDKDYIRVYLEQGQTYEFRVDGASVGGYGALSDTFFRIRDGRDPSVLQPAALAPTNADDHDQVNGLNAAIDFTAPYTGLYFISVGAGGPSFTTLTGGYQVSVTLLGAPPANQNPTTSNYIFDANWGQTISGNVLTSAQDPEGDALGTVLINGVTTTAGGVVTLLGNGTFQYQAPANGASDSFSFTVVDGAGGTASGTVSINLVEPIPALPIFTEGSDIVTLPNYVGPYYGLGGNDVFTTASTINTAFGGDGGDTFIAGVGEYDFVGGPGNDLFIAGPGATDVWGEEIYASDYVSIDTIDFSAATGSLNLDLLIGSGNLAAGIGFMNISSVENVVGTAFADTIRGGSESNYFIGSSGSDLLLSFDGDDTLEGGSNSDTLQAGNGDDRVFGGADDDYHLDGGAGQDFVDGGSGNDTVYGGAENDILNGGSANDFIIGEDGDDFIIASDGNDSLRGNGGVDTVDYSSAPGPLTGQFTSYATSFMSVSGWSSSSHEEIEILIATELNDTITADANAMEIRLGAGDDELTAFDVEAIFGDAGDDLILAFNAQSILGGSGSDDLRILAGASALFGGIGHDSLYGGALADVLDAGLGNDSVQGRDGNDTILASDGRDTVAGEGGADDIDGGAGNDRLFGDGEADTLHGGANDDMMDGGAGDDTMAGEAGRDSMLGGDGVDTLHGFGSHDTLLGGVGNDDLRGGSGKDLLNGTADNDIVRGFSGDDRLFGGGGVDTLLGGDDNDSLIGGGGGDRLKGDAGNDTLNGSFGADTLTGGLGDDQIDFRKTHGADIVDDFVAGAASEDVVRLIAFGAAFDTFAEVIAAATQLGADVAIDFGGGDTLILKGVLIAELHANDFAFG